MLMKISDLVRQLLAASASAAQAPAAKRMRTDGPLQAGERIQLAADTPVELLPAGPGVASPLGGELLPELAAKIEWVFSHFEEPGGLAHIMNLPCGVDARRYPLYYLCGNVPADRVARKPGGGQG